MKEQMMYKKIKGTAVIVKDNENINQALRRLKRKVDDAGTLDDLRKKEFYEKPTTAKKRKAGAAKARWRKKMIADQLPPKLF
jgi:small subunit ribosomal protein S21